MTGTQVWSDYIPNICSEKNFDEQSFFCTYIGLTEILL